MTMGWQGRHGWKWIGTPQSGVVGLFPEQPPRTSNKVDSLLSDAPSPGASDPVEATPLPDEFPQSVRLVLLAVEMILSLAVGLLSVWCASLARALVWPLAGRSSGEIAYAAVFLVGILAFFGTIFQQPDRYILLQRLGVVWTPVGAVLMSLGLHSAALLLAGLDIQTAPTSDILSLRTMLLAPLEEELFFRGLLVHLSLHRLGGDACGSALVSSIGFALVHVANARLLIGVDDATRSTLADLIVQIAWAGVVGLFLALRYVRVGSLLECILLHALNNVFAAVCSASSLDATQTMLIGILSIVVYGLASVRELRLF